MAYGITIGDVFNTLKKQPKYRGLISKKRTLFYISKRRLVGTMGIFKILL